MRTVISLLAVAFAATAGARDAGPVLVVGLPGDNEGPVTAPGWLAWMHGTIPNPMPPASRTVVLVRRDRGRPWRANPPGTYAETGGFTGGRLIIQVVRGTTSRLVAVDLRTHRLTPVASRFWPWKPSASGTWVLYGRIDYGHGIYAVVISNLATRETRVLDQVHGHGAYAAPGQVNGRYATFLGCPDNHCRAFRYDIRSRRTVPVPSPGGYEYAQFGPSVTADGTVYVGSARGCADVRLMRWRRGRLETVHRFPPHTAFQYSSASAASVYYDQVGCERTDLSSIYRLRTF